MATYEVKVVVEYCYEVEADSEREAEALGGEYENYPQFAEVYSVDVECLDDEEDEEED